MRKSKWVLDANAAAVLFTLGDRGELIKPDLGYAVRLPPSQLNEVLSELQFANLVQASDGSTGLVKITDAGRQARNLAAHGVRPAQAISELPDAEEIDRRLRRVLGG